MANAKIKSVSGSGAKKVFNRAFAIVESKGKNTFFIAPSYAEYEKWIGALGAATRGITDPSLSTAPAAELPRPTASDTQSLDGQPSEVYGVIAQTDTPNMQDSISHAVPTSFDDRSVGLRASDPREMMEQQQFGDSLVASDITPTPSYDVLDDDFSYSSTLDESEMQSGRRGAKFRDRMSKLSAKVKDNVKTINEKNAMNPVFARRQQNRSSSTSGVSGASSAAIKLRHVSVKDEEPHTKEPIKIEKNQQLLSIPDVWDCEVKIDAITASQSPAPETIVPDRGKDPEFCFDIQLSRRRIHEEGLTTQRVKKSLSDMLHFHSTISATLVAIQNAPSAAGLSVLKGEGSNEVFAQVIYSGKMLHGLMLHLKTSAGHSNFEYIGQCSIFSFHFLIKCNLSSLLFTQFYISNRQYDVSFYQCIALKSYTNYSLQYSLAILRYTRCYCRRCSRSDSRGYCGQRDQGFFRSCFLARSLCALA